MPSGSVSERLNIATNYVDRIGDETIREIEGETADGRPVEGVKCEHGEHIYLVLTATGQEHVTLRYSVSGDEAWHVRTLPRTLDLDDPRINISQSDIQQARSELQNELEAQPDEIKREFRLNLLELLSKEGCALTLDTENGPLNIHGFTIDKSCYIHDDDFGVGDFDYAVQTIVNLGWVGGSLLVENYGLGADAVGQV